MARAGGCATGTPGDGIAGGREPGRAGPTGAADIRGHGVLSVVELMPGWASCEEVASSWRLTCMTAAAAAATRREKGETRI